MPDFVSQIDWTTVAMALGATASVIAALFSAPWGRD
jgi:hypothetical protein